MRTCRRRFRLAAGAAALVAIVLLAACDWTQFRYGPDHTGFNLLETTIGPANVSGARLRWSQRVGSQGLRLPTTVADGVLYAVADKVYAYDASTGGARWSSDGIGVPRSGASVANGVVYLSTDTGLHALDATTGAKLWSSATGGSAPTVADGVLYISTDEGLLALAATTGARLWSSTVGGGALPPAVVDGVAYVSTDTGLYALNATTGATLWSNAQLNERRTPAVTNGVVYVSTENGLHAVRAATGVELWSVLTNGGLSPAESTGTPAVANGVVYIGGDRLYAFDAATGAPRWSANIYPAGAPTVANGVVYVGADRLYAYNAVTGGRLWSSATYEIDPVIANGIVYVGGDELHAYSLPITGPQLSISPALDRDFVFGDPYSDTRIYTITNFGSASTTAVADSLSGPDAASFRLASDGCAGTSLASGASCAVTASFAPTRPGSRTAWLTATATAGGTVKALLEGTAPPLLTFSPTSRAFPDTFAGSTSTAVFRLTNFTAGPVGPISNAAIAGRGWIVTDDRCAGKTIATRTSCTIAVAFAPSDSVDYAATLSADAPGRHVETYLNGRGLARLQIAPSSKSFGSVGIGTLVSATFTITNISPLTTGPITDAIVSPIPDWFSSDYLTITSDNSAGHALAATATCTLVVTFAPTSTIPQWGNLTATAPMAGTATATMTGAGI